MLLITHDVFQVYNFKCAWYKSQYGKHTVKSSCVHGPALRRCLSRGDNSTCDRVERETPSNHRQADLESQETPVGR